MLALLVARDIADLGMPDVTLEDLLDEWRGSDVDLADDARVVLDGDGALVGYGMVRRPGAQAVVHPAHEGQGIGTRLLEWAEDRGRGRGREFHRQWVGSANESARALLTGAGYAVVRTYWRMACTLDDVAGLSPARVPDVFELRAVDVDRDADALHALDAASFASRPDYVPESLAEFREEHLEAHDFAPELSRVVHERGTIVGFLLARRWDEERVGYVDILAVDPRHQRRGLGTALLRSAFDAFAAARLGEAQLGVDSDNPRALHVYERAGMGVRFRTDIYERPVDPLPSRR
ncbi:MAG: GNAT family N-acetyltransferase [Solirubrobacterales bacterium]|nr:GNAT family N-acetyltransferase [Solirubrobacterales bacterium]